MNFDMSFCGGCRTCELACSYRHTGHFIPAYRRTRPLRAGEWMSVADDLTMIGKLGEP